ncbi:hypothetical protein EG68_04609 [Paragonimus skrjabini miyazakii]|uniref:Uncharacterized protein n=1 Tax=Paragonimus skrjabini miyazakii TaxID=59628 RepID=A0A8S9YYY5_9TREM|nr:hypothetical protein EG68_04609 [Paragonimus skrjabini miyazakii]
MTTCRLSAHLFVHLLAQSSHLSTNIKRHWLDHRSFSQIPPIVPCSNIACLHNTMMNALSTFARVSLFFVLIVFITTSSIHGGPVKPERAYYGIGAQLRNPYSQYDDYDELAETDPDLHLLMHPLKRSRYFTQRLGK